MSRTAYSQAGHSGQRMAPARNDRRFRPAWQHVGVLAGYLLLTLVMTWPMTPQFLTAIPGDSFDGWQNYWNLWWVRVALVERVQNPFVTDILFAPTGVGLYFHTLNPFNGLVTLPIQLSAGLIPAYNSVVLLSWVLGGYGVFLLTLYAIGRRAVGAAFVAGAVFTFSPFHMAHLLGHMQVMSLQWIPFYILYLLRSLQAGRVGEPWLPSALMAGFFLILTGLCDWYFVLYLFLFTGVALLWAWVGRLRRVRTGRALILATLAVIAPAAVAGLIFVVVLIPILLPMVQEVRAFSFMVRPPLDLYILSASLMDFLVPNRLHTLFRPDSFTWIGNQIAPVSERTIALGYVPLVLVVAALWRQPRRAWFWVVVALVFLLLALGPRVHVGDLTWETIPAQPTEETLYAEPSFFGLVNRFVPMVRLSRSVSRYALMVQLGVAVAAGIGLAALARRYAPAKRIRWAQGAVVLSGVALAGVLAEFWVAPYPMSPPDTPDYYARLDAELPPGAVLNLPMNYDRPGYLLYQTVHRRPLTVAYISRDDPRTATERYPFLQHLRHLGVDILADDPVVAGKQVLADLGVGAVVLDRYKMPGGLEREYTETVARELFAQDAPQYEDERIAVYAVHAPDQAVPYLALGELHWGPLQIEEDGARWRAIGQEQPVEVWVHHAPPGSGVQVRFVGEPGTTLRVADINRHTLEAAAHGAAQTLIFPLPAVQGGEPIRIALQAVGGEIRIISVGLLQVQ